MKYKFIACDYDDTLLPKSGVISDFTKDTIREYIARGGRFAICTGRMFKSIVKIAREFGLHGEIISYQGSLIKISTPKKPCLSTISTKTLPSITWNL